MWVDERALREEVRHRWPGSWIDYVVAPPDQPLGDAAGRADRAHLAALVERHHARAELRRRLRLPFDRLRR
jgi:hypothetical protein